ncbi:MAG: dTDP-4-dehydrorhamnose reductase [Candidatus Buchananbacteria bacterium CG10_big_fil_rev_8_21_14_0_10_42_9]|uniref:dTDP-4-dehydrorhamnose reductase n=1 Tax=Candidatus Buchananbacteria bacterium CG10_big_fil_rev_8_21_14_0_10_42_9 TaxID=1974526 RepID=A0A2H0W2I4_9BACT|nr:MAG: dTDP-4-dehydrorhamnose reductase [Candidatus Buchananbacteria bacterium CG10_big_fil_rev_8_21_14_0_10_42_9]
MSAKVLILGANGMLGTACAEVFSNYDLTLWDRDQLDITDAAAVETSIKKLRPHIVINCAGYTAVNKAEKETQLAEKINGEAVGNIAQACKPIESILIHFSTDYVFNGESKDGYVEFDTPEPLSAYGKSKHLGEQLLQKYGAKYYLIRTSWLFGPNGHNFVDTIQNLAKSQKWLKVVIDQHGNPTYTLDLAKKVKETVETEKPYGIYHVTNFAGPFGTTWYNFAKAIIKELKLNAIVVPWFTFLLPGNNAKRPKWSVLKDSRLEPLRPWQEALVEYLNK